MFSNLAKNWIYYCIKPYFDVDKKKKKKKKKMSSVCSTGGFHFCHPRQHFKTQMKKGQ